MLSAPPGFFLFWVRFRVKAIPPQKLRRNKTKKDPNPMWKFRRKDLALRRIRSNSFGGWKLRKSVFTHLWAGKNRIPGLPQTAG